MRIVAHRSQAARAMSKIATLSQSARQCSDAEWETRVDLAACYRLVDHYGMCDMHLNHISARVPGKDEHFLINPFGMMYEEITASSLIKLDLEGNVIANADPEYGVNLPGFVIHSAIHRARPDAKCVLHTHTPAGMAVSALKCGLLPMTQTAMRWGKVAYHDYEGVVVNLDEQKRLVENLGDAEVMIMRNHGLLAVGETIATAFASIVRLERACQAQLMAMACNTELSLPPQHIIDLSNRQLAKAPTPEPGGRVRAQGMLEWPALKRMLDRRDPSYKN
jgi:ribulose-5-phosphate 4-epimerase/fuculose-1-phosphate aldolase